MSLIVERVQYGVGQGAFHTQSITIDDNYWWRRDLQFPPEGLRFDFVFDCGSDESKVSNPLPDSIKHYRPKRSLAKPKEAEIVDALFISHFHNDHINGISQLCNTKTVNRIFAPFHTEEDVLAVILRSSEWLEATQVPAEQLATFLTELGHLYRRERLFGRPTIYVIPPNMDNGIQPPESLTDPELPPFPAGLKVPNSVNTSACFSDGDALTFGATDPWWDVWEIKTWHFRLDHPTPSTHWQQAIKDLKVKLSAIFGTPSAISPAKAKGLLKKVGDIRKDLCKALDIDKVKHAGNHNLVSLCVYSGPPTDAWNPEESAVHRMNGPSIAPRQTEIHLDFSLRSPKLGHLQGECHAEGENTLRTGWLGTGDTPLGDAAVWQDFDDRLGWLSRSERVATVQIPHHGSADSSAGSYYNPKLLGNPEMLAVISAAAYSNDKHPTLAVLSDILQRGNPVVHIHEFVRPGLIEIVKVDY